MIDALVRPARLEDAESLHQHCYPETDLNDVRQYLAWCLRQAQQDRIFRLVAEVDGQAVGNAQLTVWGHEGEIGSLVVAQPFRCRGLARRLILELIDQARQRGLVAVEIRVSEHQPAILAFYQRLGFTAAPTHKKELPHSAFPEPIAHLRMCLLSR